MNSKTVSVLNARAHHYSELRRLNAEILSNHELRSIALPMSPARAAYDERAASLSFQARAHARALLALPDFA